MKPFIRQYMDDDLRKYMSDEAIARDKRLRIVSEAMRASCNNCPDRGLLCDRHIDEWWEARNSDAGLVKMERKYSALGENA